MKAHYSIAFSRILIAIAVFASFHQAQESEGIHIQSIRAQTNSGLVITAEIESNLVIVLEDLIVSIKIENKGEVPVYLVKDNKTRVEKQGNRPNFKLNILPPDPSDHKKDEYEYSFHEVKPNQTFSDKLVVPGRFINTHDRYFLRVYTGFVTSIEDIDLDTLKRTKDPWGLRTLLTFRLNYVRVGEFELDVTG